MQTNEMARKLSLAKALGEPRTVTFLLENYSFNDTECFRLTEAEKMWLQPWPWQVKNWELHG